MLCVRVHRILYHSSVLKYALRNQAVDVEKSQTLFRMFPQIVDSNYTNYNKIMFSDAQF